MHEGMQTPWGLAHTVHVLTDQVLLTETFEHGGLLIEQTQARSLLSPRALRLGKLWNTFVAFEQDDAMQVVFYEHPELYPWAEEELIQQLAEASLRAMHPDYFAVPATPVEARRYVIPGQVGVAVAI